MNRLMKIFALSALIGSVPVCVGAEKISAELDNSTVTVGKMLTLSVKINSEKLSGVQFDVLYDDDVLEFSESTIDTIVESQALVSGINSDKSGMVSFLAAFSEECDLNNELCSVVFKAVGNNGDKSIRIANIKLMCDGEKLGDDELVMEFKTKGRAKKSGGLSHGGAATANQGNNDSVEFADADGTDNKQDTIANEENSELIVDIPSTDEADTSEPIYIDIDSHWAKDDIEFVSLEGIVSGVGENKFMPDSFLKRSQLAVMISKALELEDTGENLFEDVSEDSWCYDAVNKCYNSGIIIGADNKFRPDDYVTREELAVIMVRACEYIGISKINSTNVLTFTDSSDIHQWAVANVADAVNSGIISGFDDNTFRPLEYTTRAQATVVIAKMLKNQWEQ